MTLVLVCGGLLIALLVAGLYLRKTSPDVSLTYFGVAAMDVITGVYIYFASNS